MKPYSFFYVVVLLTFSAPAAMTQSYHWQIGIGIRPQYDLPESWFLTLKRGGTGPVTWRGGFGGSHSKQERTPGYHTEWSYGPNDTVSYVYSTFGNKYLESKVRESEVRSFLGLERKFRITDDLSFYLAADLLFDYRHTTSRISHYGPAVVQPGIWPFPRVFDAKTAEKVKTWSPGTAIGLGLEYFVAPNVSIQVETGLSFSRNFLSLDDHWIHQIISDDQIFNTEGPRSSLFHDTGNRKTTTLDVNLIRLLTLQYYW